MSSNTVLTESDLRAYFKCSQFHWFGNKIPLNPMTDLLRQIIEQILTMRLSGTTKDNEVVLSEAMTRVLAQYQLQQGPEQYQLLELQTQLLGLTIEFFKIFSLKLYQPIYGPSSVRVRVSRTPIDAQFSCLLRRADSQELHMIVWTPYITHQDQLNDPLNVLRINAFEQFAKFSTSRANCTVHLLTVVGDELLYSSLNDKDIEPMYRHQLVARIQALERKEHFPLVPCNYACPHKQFCSPLGLKEKHEPSPAGSAGDRDHRFRRLY